MIQNTTDDAIEIRASLGGVELRFSSNLMGFLANRKECGRFHRKYSANPLDPTKLILTT